MQSANSLAMQELNQKRDRHKAELEANTAKVRALAPEYAGIESDMLRAGNALLRTVLNGGNDFDSIKSYIEGKQKEKRDILKRLSLPDDFLDEKYDCDICRDTGFDQNGLKCDCLKSLIAKYITVNSNMTELMKTQTFDSFDFSLFPTVGENGKSPIDIMKKAYDTAKDFANDCAASTATNLLLMGDTGTGKTFLSSCIANQVLSCGKTVYYQTSYKLCELMENVKFNKYENPDELQDASSTLKYANDADLLIVDDLGTEFITQFTAAALFDLLNTRILKNKATIISTNLSLDKISNVYSERLTSRILGDYLIVPLNGEDLRRRKYQGKI